MPSVYTELYSAVKDRYALLSNQKKQEKTNQLWNELKLKFSGKDLQIQTHVLIKKLKEETTAARAKLTQFFVQAAMPSSSFGPSSSGENQRVNENDGEMDGESHCAESVESVRASGSNDEQNVDEIEIGSTKQRHTPVQDAARKKIETLEKKIHALTAAQNSGLGTTETEKMIKEFTNEFKDEKAKLKRKQDDVERQKKSRAIKKAKLIEVCETHPEVAKVLKVRPNSRQAGRPRIEEGQPELLEAIIDIAIYGSGADDRRRSEMIRCCKTLADLHKQLQRMGYEISKSAVYTRLIPKRANSSDGKRHVNTVPVKLTSAQNSEHQRHSDTEFCIASIRALESLASFLGPKEVFFLSQDDKARIPLGITAAQKQQAILMHLEYRVILPDHNFAKGPGHKFVPSVYATVAIKENGMGSPEAVGYSGPTYIAIRSAKHSSSSALSHANDFEKVLEMDIFEKFCKTESGVVKPVIIISVDGGPDENPRYEKVIKIAIQRFKKFNLDAIFVVTNAPGRSAFNRVERRMAPLSHELSGLLLPYDHFGSHLSNGQTVNEDLEKENFKYAANILCETWNNLSIDGYDVEASYIEPGEQLPEIQDVDPVWYMSHVRESQYLLQITKCSSEHCCSPHRSQLRTVLPTGFLPPPTKVSTTYEHGLQIYRNPTTVDAHFAPLFVQLAGKMKPFSSEFKQVPYDLMCPSIQSSLPQRVCQVCGLYFASQKSAQIHKREVHPKYQDSAVRVHPVHVMMRRDTEMLCVIRNDHGEEEAEWIDVEDIDGIEDIEIPADIETPLPVIEDLRTWLASPWTT